MYASPFSWILPSVPSIRNLANGAVIPANHEFWAIRATKRSGTSIEAPLSTKMLCAQLWTKEAVSLNGINMLATLIRVVQEKNLLIEEFLARRLFRTLSKKQENR